MRTVLVILLWWYRTRISPSSANQQSINPYLLGAGNVPYLKSKISCTSTVPYRKTFQSIWQIDR